MEIAALRLVVAFCALVGTGEAFSAQPCRHQHVKTALMATFESFTAPTDRKTFLQTAITVSVGAAVLTVGTTPAHADVTNKVASSAALRTVKLSQKKFAGLETLVQGDEYAEFKEALRVAPFSDIRKSMSTLVKGGEDGPDAEALQDKYKTFIARLEKMDSTAGQALRGKKLKEGEFSSLYHDVVDALADFLETAQAAAEVPVQYAEESS